MPRHPPCAHNTLRPRGIPPGAEGLEHDGTWYLYQWNKIKEIAFIRHEDAQAFPADSFGNAAYELLCANVFHDMEIRYVDIFASNRYAALKVPGNPGSRMLGRNGSSRRGLVRRTLLLRTRSFRMIRGSP